jgi:hypothetical protein
MESTVALLDPDAVALLLNGAQTWDGHHWVKSSVFTQPAFLLIGFSPSTAPTDAVTVAVIDTASMHLHPTLMGRRVAGSKFH